MHRGKRLFSAAVPLIVLLVLAACSPLPGTGLQQPIGPSQPVVIVQAQTVETATPIPTVVVAPGLELLPEERIYADIYRHVNPSVVNIRVTKKADALEQNFQMMPNGPNIPGMPPGVPGMPNPYGGQQQQGEGSGFVWDDQGHIVSNNHVLDNAELIEVTFFDDTTLEGTLVGQDPHSDLAVIKVDATAVRLYPVAVGDSDTLTVGQLAIAIGNPFGQVGTMTSGIVSALGRSFKASTSQFSITRMIQTDASINPGNSGGPLMNAKGEVIGINTLILSQSGTSSGVGFAIPINMARRVVPALITAGRYEYAWLGITGGDLNLTTVKAMNLPVGTRGALLTEVNPDGPAAKAGLQGGTQQTEVGGMPASLGGDIVVSVDDQPVNKIADLLGYLTETARPGQAIRLGYLREGQHNEIAVTLGTRPTSTQY